MDKELRRSDLTQKIKSKLRFLMIFGLILLPLASLLVGYQLNLTSKEQYTLQETFDAANLELQQLNSDLHPARVIDSIMVNFARAITSIENANKLGTKELEEIYSTNIKKYLLTDHKFVFASQSNELIFSTNTNPSHLKVIKKFFRYIDNPSKFCFKKKSSLKRLFSNKLNFVVHLEQTQHFSQRTIISRSKDSVKALYYHRQGCNKYVLIVDLTDNYYRLQYPYLVNSWQAKSMGLAFASKTEKKSYFSCFFNDHPELQKYIKEYAKKISETEEVSEYKNFKILARETLSIDPKIPVIVYKSFAPQHFSGITVFFVLCILPALFGARYLDNNLNRLSVKSSAVILIVSACSFWGPAYVVSVNYRNELYRHDMSQVANYLSTQIDKLDKKGFRSLAEFINFLKATNCLDSMQKIAGEKYSDSGFSNFFDKFTSAFVEETGYDRFRCLIIRSDKETYYYNDGRIASETPSYANFLIDRTYNVMQLHNKRTQNAYTLKKPERVTGDDLLSEVLTDSVTSLLGAHSYIYGLILGERLIEVRGDMRGHSFYRTFLKVDGNIRYAFLWLWRVEHLNEVFLKNNLSQKSDPVAGLLVRTGTSRLPMNFSNQSCLDKLADLDEVAHKSAQTRMPIKRLSMDEHANSLFIARNARHLGGIIAGQIDTLFVLTKQSELKTIFAIVFLVILSVTVLFALGLGRKITNPLSNFLCSIRSVDSGDYKATLNLHDTQELEVLSKSFNKMTKGLAEGSILKKYVSGSARSAVLNTAKRGSDSEKTQVTVLFLGIADFETYCNSHTPTEIMNLLQLYLDSAETALEFYGGETDKMIGEKIMIVFNERKFANKCTAALAALQVAEQTIIRMSMLEPELRFIAGINSGTAISGLIGADEIRLDFTVIGDAVNLAARLLNVAAQKSDGKIMISGHSKVLLKDKFNCIKMPELDIKGKREKVEIWEVI